MADVLPRDPRDWLECVQEPDAAAVSIQQTKEGGPASTATPGNKREGEEVGMTTVRASDLPPLDVNGTNSPRTRVGRGLESIGGMTADTFQRFTTVVGGVVKSPVTLMAKVGSLASPQSASRTSPLAASRTSSQVASPTLPLPASPTSPKAASLILPEAENLTSPEAASVTLPEEASLALPQAATPTSPEEASPTLPDEASLALPEEASLALPEASIPTFPEEASLALPEAASVTSTPSMSLEERLCQLEIQMKSFEERFNLKTGMPELNVSPRSLEENPRLARSLMQEMETEGTLEKRVQMLEESLHERMESVEKALLIIQSQLAHVDLSKYDSVAGYDTHDSPSGELEFYDAEQQVEILEILELSSFEEMIAGARYERGEDTGASAPFEEIPVNKSVPTTEINAGRSSDVSLEPQLAHTSVESKQFFLPELMEAAAPSAEPVEHAQELDAEMSGYVLLQPQVESTKAFVKEPREAAAISDELAESAQREDGGTFPVSSDRQLVSTLSDLHESFVTEPSAVAASAKFLDIARADSAEKSSIIPVSFELQSAFVPEDPQEAFEEQQPLIASSVADFEEPAEEDVFGKSGTGTVASESPLASLLETPQRDFVPEFLAAASSAEPAQELAMNEDSDMAFTPSEPQAASKFVEEPSAALLSANLEEPAQEDVAEKSGTVLVAKELPFVEESPFASSFEEPHEDFAKESLAAAPSAELAQLLATNEDGYMALASSDTQVASRYAEEPSAAIPSDHFEEPAQEDAADKSKAMLSAEESPLLASSEEPEDNLTKESLAAAPSDDPAHGLATEASDAVAPAFSEPEVASRSVEFPSATVPNDNAEEPAEELPLLSSYEEPQEEYVKESLAGVPSAGPAHGLSSEANDDVAPAFSEPQFASRALEYQSAAVANDNVDEPAQEDAADKSGTMLAAEESPLMSSYEEPEDNSVQKSLAAGSSAGLAYELLTREDSDMGRASPEPQEPSRSEEEPSAVIPSASFEEPVRDIAADESGTILAAEDSPLLSSFHEPGEDSVKESLAGAPSAGPTHGLATEVNDAVAPAFSEPQVASKSVEDPSAAVPNDNVEEPAQEDAHEDAANKSETMFAAEESPLLSSSVEPEGNPLQNSLAAAPSAGPAHGLATEASDNVPLTFFLPQVASKSVEYPLAAVPNDNVDEPAQEDVAEKSDSMLAAVDSPLVSSLQEPEDDTAKESLVAAPTAVPAHGIPLQEDSGGYSDMAVPEPRAASTPVEEQSAAGPSANFEAPAREVAMDKDGTMPAHVVSPSAASFEEPQEVFKKEILAPAQESVTREDSDVAPAFSQPQVASKFVEEPSAAVPSANFEEPAGEDADDTSGANLAAKVSSSAASFEEPKVDSIKEDLVDAPSAGTARELLPQVNSSGISDMALAEPGVASTTEEDPSAAISSANFEEPAGAHVAEKSGTVLAAEESPFASSFEEPQGVFAKESLAVAPSAELAQKLKTNEDSDMASASPDIQVASRSVEEPSAAIPSANFEVPAQEDVAEKSVTMLAAKESPSVEESPSASSFGEPHKEFAKESLAAAPSAEPAQVLATDEDGYMAIASSDTQAASRYAEEPPAAIPSDHFQVAAQEDAADKSKAMLLAEESPLLASSEEPEDNLMKESLAAAPSADPAHGLATEASDAVAHAFFEPQVASKFVEDPSAAVPIDNVEEPAPEDAAEKSGTMPAAMVSPLASSLQEPEDDTMKESLVAGASAKVLEPAQEEEYENSAIAQETLVKEPLGGSVQLEGPAQEKSGTWTSTVEEPQNVTVGEDYHALKEAEYKLAEDVKVPDEHVKDIEEVSPKSQSNLARVDSDERKPESLASQDSDERVESGESGEEFFDAEQESGHFKPWDSGAQKPFEEFAVGPGEPGEASGSNAIAQKSVVMEPLVPSPSTEPAQEPENFEPEHGHEPAMQEHEQQLAQEHGYEPVQEPAREPAKFEQVPAQAHEQEPAQEPAQENLAGKSDVALASSEPLVSATFDHPQELLAEERVAAEPRVNFEEPAQANAADESGSRDLPFTFKAEEPQIGSSEENLSSAKFHESGNPEPVESLEQKSLDEAGIAVDTPCMESTPHEALGKVPLTTSAPTTESGDSVLEHDVGKSDHVHIPSELQLASASEESKEAYVNEPMKAAPSFESATERAQKGDDGTVAAFSEPATSQKPHENFAKELSAAALSAFKSGEPEESLAEEPRAVTPPSKLAQKSGVDRSSPGLVEGSSLTSIEEPRYGSVSSLVEGKRGHNEVELKPTEDVNFPPGLIEEAVPRSQSDSTLTKLKPGAAQDTGEHLESIHEEKHHDHGSFLTFAAPSAFDKEPSPAAKLVQLFEREDVRRSGTVRQYSPATSMVTEPAEWPAEQPLAAVSSSPKVEGENHARRGSFARSTSEPQFVYKSGDHRHALAKEPSVVVVAAPSALNLEQHAQEGSADVQCLPFKLHGEGKPWTESELKLAEDVYGSARKTEPTVSYVLEPKPFRIKEKKKREKKDKERKHESPPVEEKATRRSFRSGEMERKGSVRGEEKDSSSSNSLLRSEEKHKQPFRHWRDRLRHAFGTTKDA